jgi:hypothetical protein
MKGVGMKKMLGQLAVEEDKGQRHWVGEHYVDAKVYISFGDVLYEAGISAVGVVAKLTPSCSGSHTILIDDDVPDHVQHFARLAQMFYDDRPTRLALGL